MLTLGATALAQPSGRSEVGGVEGDGDRRAGLAHCGGSWVGSDVGPGSTARLDGWGTRGSVRDADDVAQPGEAARRELPRRSSVAMRAGAEGSWNTIVPDRDGARPGGEELQGVQTGTDATHAEDRHLGHRLRAPATRTAPRPGGPPGRTARR